MRSLRLLASGLVSLSLAGTMLSVAPGVATAAPAGAAVSQTTAAVAAPAARKKNARKKAGRAAPFQIVPGLRLNNPRGNRAQKNEIRNYVLGAINATPAGQTIKLKSWSFRSPGFRKALINAHKRGVGVQLIIDRGTLKPRNPDFTAVRKALGRGNAARPPELRSFAAVCKSSCRGVRGIAHDKYFLFSSVAGYNNVTMYGSANLTDLAASIQWNDLYTIVNDPGVYNTALNVFNQSPADYPYPDPVATVRSTTAPVTLSWFPWYGPQAVGDPITNIFNQVQCAAPAGYGFQGRTVIRVSQTAILDERGIQLARQLRGLRDAGCDVKVLYSLMGSNVGKVLRAGGGGGPVPLRQLAVDRNRDKLLDRYLHHKVITVNGGFEGRGQAVAWNGSSNWSASGLASDETFARVDDPGVELAYRDFVNKWFVIGPGKRSLPKPTFVSAKVKNPLRLLQQDR